MSGGPKRRRRSNARVCPRRYQFITSPINNNKYNFVIILRARNVRESSTHDVCAVSMFVRARASEKKLGKIVLRRYRHALTGDYYYY